MEQKSLDYCSKLSKLSSNKVKGVLTLIYTEKRTVPFVARYRKEQTMNADETEIRDICTLYDEYQAMNKRREFILETLSETGVLTESMKLAIVASSTLTQLEDIYAPYKSKRKTHAQIALDNGLGKFAENLFVHRHKLNAIKESFTPTPEITSWESALEGMGHIIISWCTHHVETKEMLREYYSRSGKLSSKLKTSGKKLPEANVFQDYFDVSFAIKDLKTPQQSHRYLALRRGIEKNVLRVSVEVDEDKAIGIVCDQFIPKHAHGEERSLLRQCATTAYTNYLKSSLDTECKTALKKVADEFAIDVFAKNLKNLLLAPYLGSKTVLAIDPGIRTGCKVVVISETGKLEGDFVIYLASGEKTQEKGAALLAEYIRKFQVKYIAIGNGTYGRETLKFVKEKVAKQITEKIEISLVSESGASIYSASKIAKEEFPDQDVTVRGAISIGRRFQDPLAELVKIDPQSIGVGQYQHDVNSTSLKKSLAGVVESAVNFVGVNLNTASSPLLSHIAGIGPTLAKGIVKQRESKGQFVSRKDLFKVPRMSDKVFSEASGFLKIYDGENPLDQTSVHPERYPVLESWIKKKGYSLSSLFEKPIQKELEDDQQLKMDIGEHTFNDLLVSLRAPGLDPRKEFTAAEFDVDTNSFEDVKIGSWYVGIVTNVTKFGAFVDIGIKENGLIHLSQLADKFVKDPLEIISVGDEVRAKVINLDKERKRIGLSLRK
ncbi:helix-hairpin-helix domain-containing protein [Bacteriovoracaceae bacterium]|nr:helix-hairpin-helix domain-containing protein [Bacteriovoracaceae bacterium]